MGKLYRIRDGERFVQPSGDELGGGDTIELDEDLARLHAHRVDLVPPVIATPEQPATEVEIYEPKRD